MHKHDGVITLKAYDAVNAMFFYFLLLYKIKQAIPNLTITLTLTLTLTSCYKCLNILGNCSRFIANTSFFDKDLLILKENSVMYLFLYTIKKLSCWHSASNQI